MIVGDPASEDSKQMIQRLELWRVRWQIDQLEPLTMPLQQSSHGARLLRAMEKRIVGEHDSTASPPPRAADQGIAQGAERDGISPIRVAAKRSPGAPVRPGEEMAFPIGPGGRDLALVAATGPATGQGRQEGEFGFVFYIQIGPRRRAYEKRLGPGSFDA